MAGRDGGTGRGGPSRLARMRGRWRRRRRLKIAAVACGSAIVAALAGPVAVDRATGAVARAGECRILTVLDADRYRLSCAIVGRQTARLLGADTPASREAGCWAEFVAGTRAKWAARAKLWTAGRVEAELDGFGWRHAPLVVLTVDGRRLSGWLVDQGHARRDDGYGERGWCRGETDRLGEEGT